LLVRNDGRITANLAVDVLSSCEEEGYLIGGEDIHVNKAAMHSKQHIDILPTGYPLDPCEVHKASNPSVYGDHEDM
jgi:hypothetical protein